MNYEKTVIVQQDPQRALESVRTTLMALNFRITADGPNALAATGPGINNNQLNPLLGISQARVSLDRNNLSIQAECGALRRFGWTMTVFLVAMAVVFVVLFSLLSSRGLLHPKGGGQIVKGPMLLLVILLPFSPWPIILPLILRAMRRRTVAAIDTLLENAAQQQLFSGPLGQ